MIKTLNTISIILIVCLVLVVISQNFYPIEGMELIYEKKFYFAISYLIVRLVRNFLMRKEQQTNQ